jgi:hypothetical protein
MAQASIRHVSLSLTPLRHFQQVSEAQGFVVEIEKRSQVLKTAGLKSWAIFVDYLTAYGPPLWSNDQTSWLLSALVIRLLGCSVV